PGPAPRLRARSESRRRARHRALARRHADDARAARRGAVPRPRGEVTRDAHLSTCLGRERRAGSPPQRRSTGLTSATTCNRGRSARMTERVTARRRGSYGIDAPYGSLFLAALAVLYLVLAIVTGRRMFWLLVAFILALEAFHLDFTLRGKFVL